MIPAWGMHTSTTLGLLFLSQFSICPLWGFACFHFSVLRFIGVLLAPILTWLGSSFDPLGGPSALPLAPFGSRVAPLGFLLPPAGALWFPLALVWLLLAPLWFLLAPFWLPLAPFWLPLVPLGSLVAPFGHSRAI